MFPRRDRYDTDPALRDVPLSAEEAAWLRDHPRAVRTPEEVSHLASRSHATALAFRQARVSFDEELRRRTAAQPARGLKNTMNPETALKFLSPEQLASLFDRFSQEKLAAVEQLRVQAANELAALRGARERLAGELRATLRHDLKPDARAAVEQALRELEGTPS